MEPIPFQSSVVIPTRRQQLILMPDNKAVYNTANKITIAPTNRSNENPKTIFEHSAVQPAFKTLTVPIKKLSQTSKMGPADVYRDSRHDRHSGRRQSLEINLR